MLKLVPLNLTVTRVARPECTYRGFEIWQYEPTGEYVLRYTDFGHPAVVTTHAEIPRMCLLATEYIGTKSGLI